MGHLQPHCSTDFRRETTFHVLFLQYFAAFDLSADAGVIHAVQAILMQGVS